MLWYSSLLTVTTWWCPDCYLWYASLMDMCDFPWWLTWILNQLWCLTHWFLVATAREMICFSFRFAYKWFQSSDEFGKDLCLSGFYGCVLLLWYLLGVCPVARSWPNDLLLVCWSLLLAEIIPVVLNWISDNGRCSLLNLFCMSELLWDLMFRDVLHALTGSSSSVS